MNALKIQQLSKSFGSVSVLNQLSFTVPEHSVFGFLGQNGAGKTTTMKMILGLLKPDNGTIEVFGEKVSYGQTPTNRMIGYLPDVPEYYSYMTPKEYLRLCGEITGLSSSEINQRTKYLLEVVGLSSSKKKIGGFSRGMKQRLGIAQALLNQPRLLICDEPTSALDPVGRKEILDILSQVKDHTTVVFSTHILSDVEKICDQVAILHQGSIALAGNLEELRTSHGSSNLNISFAHPEQLQHFQQALESSPYLSQASFDGLNVTISSSDMETASSDLISTFYHTGITPLKFEVAESSLEKLFMEVVK